MRHRDLLAPLLVLLAIACTVRASAGDPYYEFIPQFMGAPLIEGAPVNWQAECFQNVTAILHEMPSLIIDNSSSSEHYASSSSPPGAVLQLVVSAPKSLLCHDMYFVATRYSMRLMEVAVHGSDHKVYFEKWKPGEYEDVQENGVRVFMFRDGILGTLTDAWKTLMLWTETHASEKDTVQFLRDNANLDFTPRSAPDIELTEKDVLPGDYLGITRLEGGDDSLIMYGTGGVCGHTAVVLRIDGELFVCESKHKHSYWPPPYGVIKTPFAQWMKQARAAKYLTFVARLAPERRARFNETAAAEFFRSVEGLPYGTSNFLFGWVDTVNGNLPPPMSSEVIAVLLGFADKLLGSAIYESVIEGFNQRLRYYFGESTVCKDMQCIFSFCDARNITIMDLAILPERDDWIYGPGPSMVCNVFVLRTWQAAGIFGPNEHFQATEFTPRDVTSLDIFDKQWRWPLSGCPASQAWCQIMGNYNMPLHPDRFSAVTPYNNMCEKCAALPPDYVRQPANC